jgi:hypothetical protein
VHNASNITAAGITAFRFITKPSSSFYTQVKCQSIMPPIRYNTVYIIVLYSKSQL